MLAVCAVKGKVAPLVIEDHGDKYVSAEKFSADAVRAFVDKFHAGDAEKYIKSEDIPADNSGPVKVVVGRTFESIVMDDDKDVMIEFYAPWCGHCKSLEPKYKELGQKLKKKSHVVLAKMDATANDYPHESFDVGGYPTIYFKPAGGKPKKYEGGREVSDMKSYIESNARGDRKGKSKK